MAVAMTARTALDEMASDGSFKRREAAWRNWISKGKYVGLKMTFFFEKKSVDRLDDDSLTQHWKFSTKRGRIEIPAGKRQVPPFCRIRLPVGPSHFDYESSEGVGRCYFVYRCYAGLEENQTRRSQGPTQRMGLCRPRWRTISEHQWFGRSIPLLLPSEYA
jgi:hypothetical protein